MARSSDRAISITVSSLIWPTSLRQERTELVELRKRVRELERTLGRKTYESEILGNGFRPW